MVRRSEEDYQREFREYIIELLTLSDEEINAKRVKELKKKKKEYYRTWKQNKINKIKNGTTGTKEC